MPEAVETAPPLAIVSIGLIFALRKIQVPVIAGRLIRFNAWAVKPIDQQSADRKRAVADHFGWKAEFGLPRKKLIERISIVQR